LLVAGISQSGPASANVATLLLSGSREATQSAQPLGIVERLATLYPRAADDRVAAVGETNPGLPAAVVVG
jgi:hypothetical protein